MTPRELQTRLSDFASNTTVFCRGLWTRPSARFLADQLSRSATSIAANYRTACRARSRREFISRLAIAVEEADGTVGWLELIRNSKTVEGPPVDVLLSEAGEVLAILAASRRTAERNDPDRNGGRHERRPRTGGRIK
jgi:four helix bundle protein